MNETVLSEISDGVAWITLNRPAALNALNDEMIDGLRAVLPELEQDPAVRCLVIRGAGDHFMAGGDLKAFSEKLDQPPEARRRQFEALIHHLHPAVECLRRMPKPVLISVKGAAAGFGLSLVLAADLAIADEDAYFTLAYSLIGTSPDGGGTFHLPRIVGLRKAMEIALLGERFSASRAKKLGIVNWVVPPGALEPETARLAGRLAEGPTAALGRTKALLTGSFDKSLEEQLGLEAESFAACAATDDFAEGIGAFVAKRKAAFKGS